MDQTNSSLKCFQSWFEPGLFRILEELANHPEIWGSPISDIHQGGTSSSSGALAGSCNR